eukprot:1807225-Alexandrium_andersonii.AAC.1
MPKRGLRRVFRGAGVAQPSATLLPTSPISRGRKHPTARFAPRLFITLGPGGRDHKPRAFRHCRPGQA